MNVKPQNHPADLDAIETMHSQMSDHFNDRLVAFQDEAYAMGRQRGRLEVFNFEQHLQRQRDFSERTFGPGPRAAGVVDHIRKELREIEENPGDLAEWIDVVILALDGAWRSGATPAQIIDALVAKQAKNEARTWPDWRSAPVDKAIEHDRAGDPLDNPTQRPEQEESAHVPDDVFEAEFMTWWEEHGQYCRSGGGDYERTFAFQAWRHLYPQLMAARAALAQPSPAPELLSAAHEAVDYLDNNSMNQIGSGSKLHRALSDALKAAPVAPAGQVPEATASAKALVEIEAKKYSLNAAGMFDSGAPAHGQTIAVQELLAGFDDDEAEDHWEAIMAYSDLRASNALFHAAELLAAAPAQGEQP